MPALAIVRRDLLRFVRSPLRTALLFAVPLVLAGIFSLVFGSGGPDALVLRVLVMNQDEGVLSQLLGGLGSQQPEQGVTLELVQVGDEGYEMMDRGEASALVRIPEGFTADLLAGRPTSLEVVKNPSERFLPGVVEEGVGVVVSVLSQVSRTFRPELEQVAAMNQLDGGPSMAQVTALSSAIYGRVGQVEKYLFPPVIQLESGTVADAEPGAGPDPPILAYFLPGLTVMGVFFFAQAVTRDILRDREAGLLRQMLTAPMSVRDYLLGKSLSVILACVIGFAVMITFGLVAGIGWGSPAGLALVVLATSVALAGTMLVITSIAGSERQGDALGTIVIMSWSMLGGAFVPLAAMPAFLRPISMSTLTYWGIDGLGKLVVDGAGVAEVLPNAVVLVAAGALLLAIGALVLRRRIAAGGV